MIGFVLRAYSASTVSTLTPWLISIRALQHTGMRNGIDSTRRAQRRRQRHRQIHIIYDRPRQDLRIAPRLLLPVRRLAQDRRHLAAGIRRGDADVRKARPDTDSLAQADRTAPSDRHDRVGFLAFGVFESFVGDVGGRVHGRLGEDAGDFAIEDRFQRVGLVDLLGRGQEEGR